MTISIYTLRSVTLTSFLTLMSVVTLTSVYFDKCCDSKEYRALDLRTRTTTSTRFFSLHAREPASFWPENEIAVVILQQGLVRMS